MEAGVFHPRTHRKHACRLVSCLVAVLGALPVAAADERPVWSFEVRELIEVAPLTHVIHLVPVPPGIHFPRTCKELVIHAHFEHGKGVPRSLREYFTEEGYDRAIRQIRRALVSSELVWLGSLAGGFGELEGAGDECLVASSGLAVVAEPDQRPAIFSVY